MAWTYADEWLELFTRLGWHCTPDYIEALRAQDRLHDELEERLRQYND